MSMYLAQKNAIRKMKFTKNYKPETENNKNYELSPPSIIDKINLLYENDFIKFNYNFL